MLHFGFFFLQYNKCRNREFNSFFTEKLQINRLQSPSKDSPHMYILISKAWYIFNLCHLPALQSRELLQEFR